MLQLFPFAVYLAPIVSVVLFVMLAAAGELRWRAWLALGAIFTVALSPLAVPILVAINFGDLTVGQFVLYKAIFGLLLGLVVTPIVALWAIADAEPEPATP